MIRRTFQRMSPHPMGFMTQTAPNASFAAVTGVILAGGRNSRMGGQHKALLQWRQRSFLTHIVERLQPQVEQLVINSNQAQLFTEFKLPIVADPFAEQRGPLAGMLAGLNYSKTPLTLFVPCDNPQLSPLLRIRMQTALQSTGADVAYAEVGVDQHYLYALMRTELRDDVQRFLQTGATAVRRWYAELHCCRVAFDDQATNFDNINSVVDLDRLNGANQQEFP
jgi:molybdenum cofactor guanylyltransferase